MKLDTKEWKAFKVNKIFNCETTSAININNAEKGYIPYITRSAEHNGLSGYFNNVKKMVNGNCITIGAEGGIAFYQPESFIPGVKVYTLRNEKLNKLNGLFLTTLLNQMATLYSYGRARILSKIKNEYIKLPIVYTSDKNGNKTPKIDPEKKYSKEGYIPDFEYMENYIKSLNYKPLTTSVKTKDKKLELNVDEWKDFEIKYFFEKIIRGKRLKSEDRENGSLKYFSASDSNNGLTDKISNPLFIEYNSLIYTTFGDCFYVEGEFTASDEISIFKHQDVNQSSGLFIATILQQNKYKYAYGRKAFKNKYINEKFKLPILYEIDENGNKTLKIDPEKRYSKEGYIPDFKFMEEYMKQLPYGDRL